MTETTPAPAHAGGEVSRDPLVNLAAAVRALRADAGEPQREQVVDALSQLARVIESLSHGLSLSPDALRRVAQRIGGAGGQPLSKADVTAGLNAALGYLLSRPLPRSHRLEYQVSANALAAELEAMDAAEAGASIRWWAHAVSAFRVAADLSFIASGRAPLSPSPPQIERAAPPSICHAMVQARAVVLELGRTQWPHARRASGRALQVLADLVATASGGSSRRDEISRIEFQAERLQRSNALALGVGLWIKTGISATLEALAKLWPRNDLDSWMTSARAAVDGIETGRSLSFQRAAVQDAFRATISVVQAAIGMNRQCTGQSIAQGAASTGPAVRRSWGGP